MSDKEIIPLLNIKQTQTTQQVQTSSTKNTTTYQFTGYGRAASAWCGYMKK